MPSLESPAHHKKQRKEKKSVFPLGSLAFVVVMTIATLNFVALVPALTAVQDRVYAHELEVAERVETELDGLLSIPAIQEVGDLASIHGTRELLSGSTTVPSQALDDFLSPRAKVNSYALVSATGHIVLEQKKPGLSTTQVFAQDASRASFFANTMREGSYVGVLPDPSGTVHTLVAAQKILSSDGTPLGVAEITFDMAPPLRGYAASLLSDEGERVFIYDDAGFVLDSYDSNMIGKNIKDIPYLADVERSKKTAQPYIGLPFHGGYNPELQQKQSGVPDNTAVYTNSTGEKIQATFLPVGSLGVTIAFEESYTEAWSAWEEILFLSTLGILLFTLLSIFMVQKMISAANVARELERGKRHTETIVSNLVNGILQYDPSFRVMMINPTAAAMLGVKEKDVLGKIVVPSVLNKHPQYESLVKVMYPVFAEDAKKYPEKEGEPTTMEMKISVPREIELQVITVPITETSPDREGEHIGYVKVLRDISREKAISKTKSEFISVAAHQLRTPLSAIKWVFKMFLDGDLGKLTPDQLSVLKEGHDSNERIIHLVGDMLNVARIEEGRFGYTFEYTDLSALIEGTIDELALKAREKEITLLFEKPDPALLPVKLDGEKMTLVMQNLISNALKYTPRGGSVTVHLKKQNSDFAEISVTDTGIGIPKAQVGKLFNKFFRASNVTTVETDGSGLGLFIVRNIIRRHGGDITIETEEHKGSTFRFTVPINETLIPRREDTTWEEETV